MNKLSFFAPIFLSVILASCAPSEPTVFGVPQNQWAQLTRAQQHQIIHAYNQRQQLKAQSRAKQKQIAAQNAPIQALISATQDVIIKKNDGQ